MLLIYVPAITTRIEYIFDLILKMELGINYQLTADKIAFSSYEGKKFNYSAARIKDEFFIKASSLLFENTIKPTDTLVKKIDQSVVLFSNNKSCDLGFDIFSAAFYMVSRYEEYLHFNPDQYGRYSAINSLAYKNKFLQFPVVNIWIQKLKNILLKKFASLELRSSHFNFVMTYDIDVAYAFKGRGMLRNAASIVKDFILLKPKSIAERSFTFLHLQKDPWDVYNYLHEKIITNNLTSIFFFLLGDYSIYDKNLSHDQPVMKKLIKKISAFSETGIHPSYKTSFTPQKISIEKKRLEKVLNKQVTKSRQHYLKFLLPETYNHLIEAGIEEEYSMCFADKPGFRAGICTPFYFYDLKNERSTKLKIFPVTFMEGTYKDYLKLSPHQALLDIHYLVEQVKNVNGTFISIWHNNTVSKTNEFKEWRDVHNKMIERLLLHSDKIASS